MKIVNKFPKWKAPDSKEILKTLKASEEDIVDSTKKLTKYNNIDPKLKKRLIKV